MHKSTCDLASRVQLYRKPRKKPPFRYTVELWCIENHEEYPVFDTNSLFCIENLIKVPLVDTALKSVVSKTHINQAFSIQDHTFISKTSKVPNFDTNTSLSCGCVSALYHELNELNEVRMSRHMCLSLLFWTSN
ncbi:hypothetical protein B0O40_1743 [Ruminococcaceae bacterium R-25]|nr:hypothetical protein B0O40_1743 [Ruminococcaceae bacterium R-25]SUQ21607.1 hypothetical protein SAMN06297423_1743 [Oscillospiraceae bacterium]